MKNNEKTYASNSWLRLCVEMMNVGLKYEWGTLDTMRQFDNLIPHAVAIIECAYSPDCHNFSKNDDLVLLCNSAGYGLRYNGKYPLSLDCYMKVLSMQENTLSRMSSCRAVLYYNIAWLYDEIMDYDSALEWYLKDLTISEAVHGREGIGIANTYNAIGSLYRKKQNYKKAMDYYKRALYNYEKAIRIYDSSAATLYNNVATVYNNIAVLYAEKKLYEKALEWHYKDLSICEKLHREKHPETAITYNNIGVIYYDMGNPRNALEWYEKSIKIKYEFLGAEHPELEKTIHNAAIAYSAIGEISVPFDAWLTKIIKEINVKE